MHGSAYLDIVVATALVEECHGVLGIRVGAGGGRARLVTQTDHVQAPHVGWCDCAVVRSCGGF